MIYDIVIISGNGLTVIGKLRHSIFRNPALVTLRSTMNYNANIFNRFLMPKKGKEETLLVVGLSLC